MPLDVKNVNAIEEVICQKMEVLPCQPMDKDLSAILINLLFSEGADVFGEKPKPFLCEVISKRIECCFQYTITDTANLFLAALTQTPGNAVVYMWYLQYQCNKHGIDVVDLNFICDLFPIGFPSEKDMMDIWDSQKVLPVDHGPDNLVDYASAGLSLMKENIK